MSNTDTEVTVEKVTYEELLQLVDFSEIEEKIKATAVDIASGNFSEVQTLTDLLKQKDNYAAATLAKAKVSSVQKVITLTTYEIDGIRYQVETIGTRSTGLSVKSSGTRESYPSPFQVGDRVRLEGVHRIDGTRHTSETYEITSAALLNAAGEPVKPTHAVGVFLETIGRNVPMDGNRYKVNGLSHPLWKLVTE